ncbi:MAG: hypothetical protein Q7U83_14950 [Daejeonella sp.]|nr:hypothetical protein [Daejeonella sp.]
MATLTVHIDNEKDLPILKEILNRFGASYNEEAGERPLNKAEKATYKRLKTSFEEIKLHNEGKIELRDARELLNEL